MDQLRNDRIVERLNAIEGHLHFNWNLFLLVLGGAFWHGFALGPAILVAWFGHWLLWSLNYFVTQLIAARNRLKGS